MDCDGILIDEAQNSHQGLSHCLKKLAGNHSLYIVSEKDPEAISSVLKKSELISFFTDIFGKDRIGEVGRYHHLFLNPMYELNIEKEQALALADSTDDIQAAKKAGIPVIACSWGPQNREELIEAQPDFIADNPQELLSIVEEL